MKSNVSLRNARGEIVVGSGQSTKVMALIGATGRNQYDGELFKLEALQQMPNGPDIVSDLSLTSMSLPLWKRVVEETSFVAATLPVYTTTLRGSSIAPQELLERSIEQMEAGVGLLTIHPTPTREIIELATRRMVPWTSRGGGMVIRDLLQRPSHEENVYMQILPELVSAASRHQVALSLGATFRSANIFDSNDLAQKAELEEQRKLATSISKHGVGVIIESPGHARPTDIALIGDKLCSFGFPVMPLGPIVTDSAIGQDHISSSIGAVLLGIRDAAHILAAVTREEHTGGIPTIGSLLEAVIATRIAAHTIDLSFGRNLDLDLDVARLRQINQTCIAGKESKGCSRCSTVCPLWK